MKTDLEDKIQSPAARKFVKKIRSQLAELFRLDPDTFEVHAFYTHGSSAYLNILLSFELPGPKVEWSGVRSIIYDELKVIYKESGLEYPKKAPFVTKSGRRVDISLEINRNELEKIQLNPGAHFKDDDFKIETWFERDRAHVALINTKTDETVIEWRDDEVAEAVEDGFLNPKNWKKSALEYAKSLNLIWGENRPMKKNPMKSQWKRVSAKIRKLIDEGYPQKQAVAIALKMSREHKLGPRGGKKNPRMGYLHHASIAKIAKRYGGKVHHVDHDLIAFIFEDKHQAQEFIDEMRPLYGIDVHSEKHGDMTIMLISMSQYAKNPIKNELMAEALAALAGLLRYPERSEDVREEVLDALEAEGYWNVNRGVTEKGKKFLEEICSLEDLPE